MPNTSKQAYLLLFTAVLLTAPLAADSHGSFSTEMKVDWRNGKAEIDFRYPLPEEQDLSPSLRRRYSNSSRSSLGYSFVEQFSKLQFNSHLRVEEYLKETPDTALELSSRADRTLGYSRSSFNEDFSEFHITYEGLLYPNIIEPFILHGTASPPPPLLRYVPSGPFSGIVIYVEEELPIHGTSRRSSLSPALFPRIYSHDMELIASKEMVAPKALKKWGMLGYYRREDIDKLPERVGEVPLYTKAVALFGEEPTDIIIPQRGTENILSAEETIRLITEGKIAVVYDTQ